MAFPPFTADLQNNDDQNPPIMTTTVKIETASRHQTSSKWSKHRDPHSCGNVEEDTVWRKRRGHCSGLLNKQTHNKETINKQKKSRSNSMASWLPFLGIVALKKGINCEVLNEWKEVNKNKMTKVQELL